MILHRDLIEKAAKKYSFNVALVMAIVRIESGFNTDAMRYESHYRWLYEPEVFATRLGISVSTERALQRFSFGMMQVMGAVARESGFNDALYKLCRPDMGLEYGCKHLSNYMKRYDNDIKKAISAYNGGPGAVKRDGTFKNEAYVNKVMNYYLNTAWLENVIS